MMPFLRLVNQGFARFICTALQQTPRPPVATLRRRLCGRGDWMFGNILSPEHPLTMKRNTYEPCGSLVTKHTHTHTHSHSHTTQLQSVESVPSVLPTCSNSGIVRFGNSQTSQMTNSITHPIYKFINPNLPELPTFVIP